MNEQKNSLAAMEDKMEAKLDEQKTLMDEQKTSLAAMENKMETKMDEQKILLEAKMDEQKTSLEAKMSEQNEVLDSKLDKLEQTLEQKLEDQRSSFNKKLDEQKLAVDNRLDAVEEQLNEHRQSIEIKFTDQDEKLGKELEQIRNDLEKVKISRAIPGDIVIAKGLNAPTFDGQSAWSVYRRQFDAAAETHHWTEEEKATALVLALRGPAAELLQTIPVEKQRDFSLIVQTIERRYGDEHMQQTYRHQLRNRVQRPGETLQQLQAELERLTYLAYPSRDQELLNEISTESFINAIRDRDIQQALRMTAVTTTGQALGYALTYEAAKQASRNSPAIRALDVDLPNEEGSSTRRIGVKCWSCGQIGHMQRDCWKRTLVYVDEHGRIRSLEEYKEKGRNGWNSKRGVEAGNWRRQPRIRCWSCDRFGHVQRDCRDRKGMENTGRRNTNFERIGRSNWRSEQDAEARTWAGKTKLRCWNCDQTGHLQNNCWRRRGVRFDESGEARRCERCGKWRNERQVGAANQRIEKNMVQVLRRVGVEPSKERNFGSRQMMSLTQEPEERSLKRTTARYDWRNNEDEEEEPYNQQWTRGTSPIIQQTLKDHKRMRNTNNAVENEVQPGRRARIKERDLDGQAPCQDDEKLLFCSGRTKLRRG